MPERLILITHSSQLRSVTEQDVVDTLSQDESALLRKLEVVDTTRFADELEAGDWDRSATYLRTRASEILQSANEDAHAVEMRYFGLAEIPHVVALGAYIGDERHVVLTDFDRDSGAWRWPTHEQTIVVEAPQDLRDVLRYPGTVVVRVAITASIRDDDPRWTPQKRPYVDV